MLSYHFCSFLFRGDMDCVLTVVLIRLPCYFVFVCVGLVGRATFCKGTYKCDCCSRVTMTARMPTVRNCFL